MLLERAMLAGAEAVMRGVVVAAALAGCSGGGTAGVEAPVYGGAWEVPAWEDLAAPDLPPGPDVVGHTLIATEEATLFMDPDHRDPVVAAGACLQLIAACFDIEDRNVHGCFVNVPRCTTDTPWAEAAMCCPADCTPRYVALRREGLDPVDASAAAVFDAPSCIPGLDAMLGAP